MTLKTAKLLRLSAMAAGLLFCGLSAGAQKPGALAGTGSGAESALSARERLTGFESAISNGDPSAAIAFLKDGEALKLSETSPREHAALLGKASALKDLQDQLALPWNDSQTNQLNRTLSIRIDADKPLSKMGIGPEPEKLFIWLAKYEPSYPPVKKTVIKKAIRQWEVVFGTMTDTREVNWGHAKWADAPVVTKAAWETWVIKERNAVLEKIMGSDYQFMVYSDQTLADVKDQVAAGRAVDAAIDSGLLNESQLAKLSGKSLEEKMFLLGSFFDRSDIAVSQEIKTKINAARSSLRAEMLTAERRELLGDMLNTAISKEMAGTKAGDKVLAFYGGQVKIALKPCDGSYSRYDAATGTIILDSETVQQYMRIKGYKADSVLKGKELAEIAKYMSPAVVYESAHQMRDAWAQKRGIYNPRVQESEIEAMSLEGLYTVEKMRKDPEYGRILASCGNFSTYASKKLEIGTEYKISRSKEFSATVRQRYASGLLSLNAAASQVLVSVTEELGRRASLPAADKAAMESSGLNLAETMKMAPEELAGSVGEIRTGALAKIQADLSGLGGYMSRYNASEREGRKALKSLEAGASPKTGAPPAL